MTDPSHPIGGLGKPLILLVDDDPRIRQVIHELLTEEGFSVITAADGLQAIQRAADQPLELLILDMGLPLMDAPEVAAALRASHGGSLPILTISAGPGMSMKAERLGAFAYLRKPFDLDDLLTAVRDGLAAA